MSEEIERLAVRTADQVRTDRLPVNSIIEKIGEPLLAVTDAHKLASPARVGRVEHHREVRRVAGIADKPAKDERRHDAVSLFVARSQSESQILSISRRLISPATLRL